MSFIEGATFHGHQSELTVAARDAPSKTGSSVSRFNNGDQAGAYLERNTSKTGSRISVYDAELAALLGPEFG